MQKMKKDRKVTFLDSKVLQKFSEIVAIIATAATLFSVFVTIPELYKFYFGMFFCSCCFAYIFRYGFMLIKRSALT